MLWGINRYVNNSALRASSSDALVLLPDMLTIRHYVPHPRSIFECIIQSQNTNTISALRASNLALIEELTRKLRALRAQFGHSPHIGSTNDDI